MQHPPLARKGKGEQEFPDSLQLHCGLSIGGSSFKYFYTSNFRSYCEYIYNSANFCSSTEINRVFGLLVGVTLQAGEGGWVFGPVCF